MASVTLRPKSPNASGISCVRRKQMNMMSCATNTAVYPAIRKPAISNFPNSLNGSQSMPTVIIPKKSWRASSTSYVIQPQELNKTEWSSCSSCSLAITDTSCHLTARRVRLHKKAEVNSRLFKRNLRDNQIFPLGHFLPVPLQCEHVYPLFRPEPLHWGHSAES